MTTVLIGQPAGPQNPPQVARKVRPAAGGADRVFPLSLRGAGLTVLLIMGRIPGW